MFWKTHQKTTRDTDIYFSITVDLFPLFLPILSGISLLKPLVALLLWYFRGFRWSSIGPPWCLDATLSDSCTPDGCSLFQYGITHLSYLMHVCYSWVTFSVENIGQIGMFLEINVSHQIERNMIVLQYCRFVIQFWWVKNKRIF